MATKTLTITVKAYNQLARLKKENESFSVVIERITKPKLDLRDFHGIISERSAKRLEQNIADQKKKDLLDDKKRIKEFSKVL